MASEISAFYNHLAAHYHLIFEDWDASIERQRKVLNALLVSELGSQSLKILDCACGIGTQAIGFAQSGHRVVACDLSSESIARAAREAANRALDISFHASDMTTLAEFADTNFDVAAALDNAFPHLSAAQLAKAAAAIASKLCTGGLLIASTRDYDQLILQKPTIQPPTFYRKGDDRWFVHQVWDWIDESRYILHHYITTHFGGIWSSHHFVGEYRCLLRQELSQALEAAGFHQVRWLFPAESGFFQPIVLAQKL